MLRVAAIAALLAFPAASLAARRADTPATPVPAAKLMSCDVTSNDRSATFVARMDTVPGASKLQIRFQLLERLGRRAPWVKLDVPELRGWHSSAAGVAHYAWKQTVQNLRIGGAYKAHVSYRWVSSAGSVVASTWRESPTCRGPLPNIQVGDLTVKPGPTSDTRVYRVAVANTGKIDADSVDVVLAVDRAVLDTVTITHLAAAETRSVSFTGPVCEHAIRVKADPDNSIGETYERDNSQLFACP